jgi:hypothetical protein
MKRTIIISFLAILIGSCSKPDTDKKDIQKCDCSTYLPSPESVECNGPISQSDTCKTYFAIWKEIFLEKNNMTEEYFNNHITPCKTSLHKWNDGISFEIYFKVKIGWVETKLYDDFAIILSSSTIGLYPTLSIPRSVLLSKDQISILVNNYAFSSRIFIVSPISSSKYNSQNEAMKALIDATSVDTLCNSRIFYQIPNLNFSPTGHPFIEASCVINWAENKCVSSQMDLVTGEVKVVYNACYIINK